MEGRKLLLISQLNKISQTERSVSGFKEPSTLDESRSIPRYSIMKFQDYGDEEKIL